MGAKARIEKFIGVEHTEADDRAPSISNADPFIEREPTVGEFLADYTPTFQDIGAYFFSLFPFLSWIGKYNFVWFVGDLIAGKLTMNVT